MVGQRNRVWLTRLIQGVGVALVLLIAVVSGVVWYLMQPEPPKVVDSKGGVTTEDIHLQQPKDEHPLDPVLRLARSALKQHLARDRSYAATLVKQERVSGKLAPVNRMEVKVRYRDDSSELEQETMSPRVSVYLRFVEPKSLLGREAIWNQGENDNLMTVHETGLLNIRRIPLAPNSRLAMMGNKYPISEIGIAKLIHKLIEKGVRDRKLGDCEVNVTDDFEFANRKCKRIEVVHPERKVEFNGQSIEHEFFRAIIDMDQEWEIPIHYASYMWPESSEGSPLLEEEYSYENLKLNVVFSDIDFSADNPKYNFPR